MGSVTAEEPVMAVNTQWCDSFVFGLVPMLNTKMDPTNYVGSNDNYIVRTHTTFLNGLVSGVTFGIYTPTQTTYYLPINDSKAESMKQENAKKLKTVFFK